MANKNKATIIAIYNNKGGVGKTTFAVNFAHCLTMKFNKKALVIDNDGQANATYALTNKTEDNISESGVNTIFDLMVDEYLEAKSCILKDNLYGIDVIPATDDHSDTPDAISSYVDNTRIMKEKLQEIKSDYDIIIIDCSPTRDRNIYNALFAADIVISPIESQVFSRIGLRNLLKQIEKVNKKRDFPILHYVFLNKLDNRQRVSNQQVRNTLENLLSDDFIKAYISLLSLYSKSIETGFTAMNYQDNRGAIEIEKLTSSILKKINEEIF
ncbi:ParA family protein [Clostridium butyricum]|uniref:ParA family protein n=1 Tax=Clostridium butyricum TaxID=1492 RepID=UPI002AB01B58|nr:AAA family ATPase [Clostridium butyricum]